MSIILFMLSYGRNHLTCITRKIWAKTITPILIIFYSFDDSFKSILQNG